MDQQIKIAYILGDGRSGSTLLDGILANVEGAVSVGESYRFWERFYKRDTLCSCGERIERCPMWSAVAQALEERHGPYDVEQIKAAIKHYFKFANTRKFLRGETDPEIVLLLDMVGNFYREIATVSKCKVIVDSSKSPAWAILLSRVPGFDVRFIHLERDLASVASSWKKTMVLPEYYGEEAYMPVKSNATVIRTWLRVKYLARVVAKQQYLFLTYERLCDDYLAVKQQLESFLGVDIPETMHWQGSHAIAGNPTRAVSQKEIVVRPYSPSTSNISELEVAMFNMIDKASIVLRQQL